MNQFLLKLLQPWAKSDEKKVEIDISDRIDSFAVPDNADGAIEVDKLIDTTAPKTAVIQSVIGYVPKIQNTKDLINQYRSLSKYHEVDNAIDEIINDAIVQEDNRDTVYLDLDKSKWSESVKEMVREEFREILNLLKFEREGKRHFRRWYVDSRIYFHKMIDPERPKEGIKELRLLDPRNVEYYRVNLKSNEAGTSVYKGVKEYFTYAAQDDNRYAIGNNSNSHVNIPVNAIVYAHSGKVDIDGKTIVGYLHNVIKPANQLKMLEDAMVIYRITRAPERRVFYIDVGTMPNKKATQHLNNVMQGLKNRVVYDSATGKVKNSSNNLAMTEDYWLMRRDGKATTEVSTLPGAQSMGEMDDVRWFNRKLYESMKIPLSRLPQEGAGVTFGAGSDITRDELQFTKFIRGLQQQFEPIFLNPLKTNLILKGKMSEAEWDSEVENIKVVFAKDSYYEEIKDVEILERRVNLVQTLSSAEVTGKYLSHEYVMKNILRMSDEDIKSEREKIDEEKSDSNYKNPDDPMEEF
ncbi:portal vertex protein of head [Aeromonas phage phiAS5]|uniref:Portal protein n=1 Tax=Aeromonas phage phiAS5 TaxID=879630 RepID=E1A2B1_9CAUD|nr:portal protein [Aeromonas phage phiAS5]ADM79857.1 portal vertex protein of head [Aeromonas phage phiAS5]BES53037.1 hypothetical protein [Aeromonas phage phiWae14]